MRPIVLPRLKALDQIVLQLLSGNGFNSSDPYDLGLNPTDLKNIRVFLLSEFNYPMKVKSSGGHKNIVANQRRIAKSR